MVSAELGDYDPLEHNLDLVSEFRFIPDQTEELERAIYSAWKDCRCRDAVLSCRISLLLSLFSIFSSILRGQTPAQAEINYLNKAKWLEMYGVDMHMVKVCDPTSQAIKLTNRFSRRPP